MKKIEIVLLCLILVAAFGARLYKFNSPVADWHSWRQADTSSVSRNFAENGFDLLHPKFQDLSKGVSLIDNPKGYRFVEFPLYNAAQASLFKYVGYLTLEQWGRIVTILSSLFSILFIYLICRKYLNKTTAFFAAFAFAFIPYNIYYGRVILPDSSMVAATLAGTYFFARWIDTKNKFYNYNFLLSILFVSLAFLIKPYALFFMLPLIYLAFDKFGFSFLKKWQLWSFLIITVLPLVFWQIWMRQYPSGIPRNDWLFNGNNIRFKGAFFHWIFADRIGQLILGYYGLPLIFLGMIRKVNQREKWFFFMFLLSSLIYLTTLATGNVQHDYYQVLIMPTIAIFLGKGVDFIIKNLDSIFNKYVSFALIFVSISFMLFFGWFVVRDYYNIQHSEIITAGDAIKSTTSKDTKIIAPYGGDTTLLYATGRNGWPVFDRPLPEFIKQGATVMLFVDPGEPELNFRNYFEVLVEGDKFIAFDLTKPIRTLE